MEIRKYIYILLILLMFSILFSKFYKFYNVTVITTNDNDMEECFRIFNLTPYTYWEGVKVVNIMNLVHTHYAGFYFYGSRIMYMMTGCDQNVLIHELAHHRQFIKKESYYNIAKHQGNFTQYENEIATATS